MNVIVEIKIAKQGNIIKCGKLLIPCHPLFAIRPQLTFGGEIPRPRKLNVDSARIDEGIVKLKVTIIGAKILGKISLKAILESENPITFALKTKGLLLSSITFALVIRAILIQLKRDKAKMIPVIPRPNIRIKIEISKRSGIE